MKKGKKKEFLWILEHPTTYTVVLDQKKMRFWIKKLNLIKTNRGGKLHYTTRVKKLCILL